MVGDTNAPDEDHWYYKLAEEDKPDGWVFHRQPGGVTGRAGAWKINPDAENLGNLPKDYYKNGMRGKSDDWIKVNLANEYGFVIDGKPVHPFYVDSTHCLPLDFVPDPSVTIVLGFDFGRTPACALMQKGPMDRWIVFDEFVTDGISATSFAPALKKYLEQNYKDYTFRGWGDPSGGSGNQSTDDTPFQILQGAGITAYPASTNNDPLMRRAAIEQPLKELCLDGKPRLIILPKAKTIRKGLQGGFCYRRIMVSGERYSEEPAKNEYSHPVEALEYGLQGEGEGRELVRVKDSRMQNKPVQMQTDFDVFA
jgi:hypothetical protein